MKIVVAMSGGVDSSAAALLLKEQGHEIIGVSLRLAPDSADPAEKREGRCCSLDDMTDARQVCDKLGVPFYAIDSREEFKKTVFDPFVKAYQNGQTPIPCLACNHEVKFGSLYKTAQKLGAKLATGHYARVVDYAGSKTLARPLDIDRDQTYYLYGTSPEVVENLFLPLGELKKPDIRVKAKEVGLKTHNKPDSHEICFVPDGNHAKVVEKALGPMPGGPMRNLDGKEVSKHAGIHKFTIGQRRGIGVGLGEKAYVADLDPKSNLVTLGPKSALECSLVSAKELRTIISLDKWPNEISVQIRARHKAEKAVWEIKDTGEIVFKFKKPVHSVALGQAAVCYDGDILLGGGIINGRLDGRFPRIV